MFTPKSVDQVEQELRALILARTPLSDFTDGGVAATLVRAIAHEIAATERSLYRVREGFFLGNANGLELDERVGELPPAGLTRLPSAPAAGAVLRIVRSTTTGALVIPAGSLFRGTNGVSYKTTAAATIADGATQVDNVHVVALERGIQGNIAQNQITTVVNAPAAVVSCTNTAPLTNGTNGETDSSLKSRALTYLQSLNRCQPTALDFLARSFVASSGQRMPFVSVYEDTENLGYTEVIVDDGVGMELGAVSRPGNVTQGTVSSGGYLFMYHESPATAPLLENTQVKLFRNNAQVTLSKGSVVSLPERGILYLKAGVAQPGDTWQVTGYSVFTGFIAELQQEIEGDVNNPAVFTGFRAAGTRVRVTTAEKQLVYFDVAIQPADGATFSDLENAVRIALQGFIAGIAPGQPLYVSAMVAVARQVPGVRDVSFYGRGSAELMRNVYPNSPRSAIRVDSSSIVVTNVPAS